MSGRSLVHGVGVNDGPPGNRRCQYYLRWTYMLKRCYSEKFQDRYPTYRGCTVCNEWHLLSNFTDWMKQQDHEGKALDKDILLPGNKVYSKDHCVFVDQSVNKLLNDYGKGRGEWPQGVSFNRHHEKFHASCRDGSGKQKHLGYYGTPEEAAAAYIKYKVVLIREIAETQPENIKQGLLRHADEITKTTTGE